MRLSVLAAVMMSVLFVTGCTIGTSPNTTNSTQRPDYSAVYISNDGALCWTPDQENTANSTCWQQDTYVYSSPAWISATKVTAVREVESDYFEIVSIDIVANTSEVITHTTQQPRGLTVSPDAKAIAFLVGNNGYISTFSSGSNITATTARVFEGVRSLAWLGDDKSFMFVTTTNRLFVQKRTAAGTLLDAKAVLETDVYAAAAVDAETVLVIRKGDGQFELQQVDLVTSEVSRVTSWSVNAESASTQLDTQLGLAWNRRYAFIRIESALSVIGLQTNSVLSSDLESGANTHWLGDTNTLFITGSENGIGRVNTKTSPPSIDITPLNVQDIEYRITSANML